MNKDKRRSESLLAARGRSGHGTFPLRIFAFLCIQLSLAFLFSAGLSAQVKPVYDQGALGLVRFLHRLNTSATVMMIGAHPDDEDTALLAYLARGENARTAYLSLTRGDGGQNIIGPELGEALGVIRTEELLQARKLDGAEQFFTRAYDFGFSKTLDEAKQKWDERTVLCDAVRAIRTFRPLVVVSVWTGTPVDGHGQHQFSGYIAPIAVKAAADIGQCAEAGPPWQVKKFYTRHRTQGDARLRVNTGNYDMLLGRSYSEIAMEARSQHRSQEQGVLELKGEAFSNYDLTGSEAKENDIFETLDTSVAGISKNTSETSPQFIELAAKVHQAAARALSEFDVRDPSKIIPALTEGYAAAYDAEWSTRSPGPKAFMLQKQTEFLGALRLAAGIQIDVISDRETVVPGESFTVGARVFYPAGIDVKVENVTLNLPSGWSAAAVEPTPQPQNQFRREVPNFGSTFNVRVSTDAPPTEPYWLERPRKGDLFSWDNGPYLTLPLQGPQAAAEIKMKVNGREVKFVQPVEYRYADDVRGEIRRPLEVVPKLAVALDQDLLIVAAGQSENHKQISVSVGNNSAGTTSGSVRLKLPQGWTSMPARSEFSLTRKGESASVQFDVRIPVGSPAGAYSVAAVAMADGAEYSRSMRTVAYPHIQTHRIYGLAAAKAELIDLKTVPLKIGYLAGSGDRVPQAIAQMGLNVEMIDERTLASGDLSRFDVLVVGIRAYQVRGDLVAHNKRLLDFASSGGTLIVQYQLPGYAQQNLAPFPAQQGPRVSDELAKVTILDPTHPIFTVPNKITPADFEGWVQERNLYNFSTMDARYTGLLESHDTGEAENKGGLVVADLGRGKFIFCSYSLFRQLPAGVPGAYRLLANMLAYRGRE